VRLNCCRVSHRTLNPQDRTHLRRATIDVDQYRLLQPVAERVTRLPWAQLKRVSYLD